MVTRLRALFVALVLCCCSVLALSGASRASAAPAVPSAAVSQECAIDPLSASDPMAQGQAESAADGPGLPAESALPAFTASRAALSRPLDDGLLRPPYLDGPQRPPRATVLVA